MAYKGRLLKDMTQAQREKRIASLDAGARAKVPTSYLTGPLAKYAQQRLTQQRLNAPVVPGSSLSNRDLAHEAQAAIQVQYGPQEVSLAQQVASNQQQPRVTGGYYDQWLAQIRAAAAQQQQAQTALSTQLATLGQGVAGAATGQNTANLSALQADAAKRGATVDPSLATTAAQGTAVNQGVADAQAGTAALQGQAQQGFMAALMGAAQAGRVQALNQIASQGQALAGQQTALRGQEGAANITYRSKRRTEEGQNVLNAALAGSQIDARGAATQIAQQNADAHTTTAKATAKRAAQAGKPSTVARPPSTYPGSAADWNGMSLSERQAWMKQHPTSKAAKPKATKKPAPTAGPGSLTRTEENTRASQINQVADLLLHPPKTQSGKTATRDQIIAEIRNGSSPLGKGVDPNVIAAGDSLAKNGRRGLGPHGVNAAHQAGVHVNGRWKKIRARKKQGNSIDATIQGVQGATP